MFSLAPTSFAFVVAASGRMAGATLQTYVGLSAAAADRLFQQGLPVEPKYKQRWGLKPTVDEAVYDNVVKLTQICLFVLKTFKRFVSQIVGFCEASLLLHLCLFCLLLSFSIILIALHLDSLTSSHLHIFQLHTCSPLIIFTTSHLDLCTSCRLSCSSSHHPVVTSSLFLFYCHARLLSCRVCPGNPALRAVRGEGCGRGSRAGLQGDLHHGWRCILHSILLQ